MAYKKADLEKQALKAISSKKLVFIDEVANCLPCSRSTFYAKNLDKSDTLKEALEKNKLDQKGKLRRKWLAGDNATAQIALYRLLATDDEADRLNTSKTKLEHSGAGGAPLTFNVVVSDRTPPVTSEDDIDGNIEP